MKKESHIKVAADSVWERMYLAVQTLCVGRGDVRARLVDAGMQLTPLMTSEFPEELQSDFDWVMHQLTQHPARHQHEGTIEASMARIKRKTGVKIAERILRMFWRIQELRGFPVT
jgi:hypothetical protein